MAQDLLLEIGVEELPASFVESGLGQLPRLLKSELEALRLEFGEIWAGGTPRRLAVIARGVAERQPDLDEEVVGPPSRVAFKDGEPTRAATSFASKLGVDVSALYTVETPKGEYVAARKSEVGQAASELLPAALERVCAGLSFRKSMRWSDGDVAFGRPVRWLVALFGGDVLPFEFAGQKSGNKTRGHRFLAGNWVEVSNPGAYSATLAAQHVVVDLEARAKMMKERLQAAAEEAGGQLIEDDFLVHENGSLVEEPRVVVGSFEAEFLALPERVVLDVAKDHQRYFGLRDDAGKLMPRYLAVVNTAENPDNVRRGNDRVMRARLADAKFFYDEDLKRPIAERRASLDSVVFQKRLGSVGDKVNRIQRLTKELGAALKLEPPEIDAAHEAAGLAKCDLVTLMVGEFPELQGEMGAAYARVQGVDDAVAVAMAEHYQPKGADDATAPSSAGALVAIGDRLDTLVGCFAVGLVPTGAADPLALRRAAIGLLRTLLDREWNLDLGGAVASAYAGFSTVKLDRSEEETRGQLLDFFRDRLRGLLADRNHPGDVVEATLASGASDPHDAARRASALSSISPELRAAAGEVFKRAANIAKDAESGELQQPDQVQPASEVPAAEIELFAAFAEVEKSVEGAGDDYERALEAIAELTPVLAKYFDDVLVMCENEAVRSNRLRLMHRVQRTCSGIANFNLLAKKK